MTLFEQLKIKFGLPPNPVEQRKPATSAQLAAVNGALIILTEDKSNIVLTPRLARDLAAAIPRMAEKAEGTKSEN